MFEEREISDLRQRISSLMSGYRLTHTLGVESMAARLGELYAPEKTDVLRAAALLHDITKEKTLEKQLQICEKLGIIVPCTSKASPKTLHAITAAAVLPNEYPAFALQEVMDAVRWHTTGKEDMSITEKLIYLADYIEDGRTFDDCVRLREHFFGACPEKMSAEERLIHLDRTLVLSFDMTIKQLIAEGTVIDPCTMAARNYLIISLSGSTAPSKP